MKNQIDQFISCLCAYEILPAPYSQLKEVIDVDIIVFEILFPEHDFNCSDEQLDAINSFADAWDQFLTA